MLIPIKRLIVSTLEVREMIVNMRYVRRIELIDRGHVHFDKGAKTLLILDDMSQEQHTTLIFSIEALDTIKGKITKARNKSIVGES